MKKRTWLLGFFVVILMIVSTSIVSSVCYGPGFTEHLYKGGVYAQTMNNFNAGSNVVFDFQMAGAASPITSYKETFVDTYAFVQVQLPNGTWQNIVNIIPSLSCKTVTGGGPFNGNCAAVSYGLTNPDFTWNTAGRSGNYKVRVSILNYNSGVAHANLFFKPAGQTHQFKAGTECAHSDYELYVAKFCTTPSDFQTKAFCQGKSTISSLDRIVYSFCIIGTEVCDGVDNDCDGSIDEGGVCQICGNGAVEGTEQCDDGNSNNNDACRNNCIWNVMGDGIILTGVEECDDGNVVNGDGCNSTGGIEDGWSCTGASSACCRIEGVCREGQFQSQCNADEDAVQKKDCVMNTATGCYVWESSWSTLENCEANEICIGGGTITAQCYAPDSPMPVIQWCSDYPTEAECNSDAYGVCEETVNEYLMEIVEYTEIPDYIADEGFCDTEHPLNPDPEAIDPYGMCNYYAEDCRCEWEGEGCEGIFDSVRTCEDPAGNLRGTCASKTTTENNCDTTGVIKISRTITCTEGFEAFAGETLKEYQCVETAQLPFFGWISFAVSSGAIAGVYFYLLKFGRRKGLNRRS